MLKKGKLQIYKDRPWVWWVSVSTTREPTAVSLSTDLPTVTRRRWGNLRRGSCPRFIGTRLRSLVRRPVKSGSEDLIPRGLTVVVSCPTYVKKKKGDQCLNWPVLIGLLCCETGLGYFVKCNKSSGLSQLCHRWMSEFWTDTRNVYLVPSVWGYGSVCSVQGVYSLRPSHISLFSAITGTNVPPVYEVDRWLEVYYRWHILHTTSIRFRP